MWQVGESEFCAIASYHGSFTTLAGQSPGNADDISEGINGKMDGGYRLAITGASLKDMPDQPPHSNLGKYDYGCDADPSCPGQFNWLDIYFDAYSFPYDWWGWMYHTPKNGIWINASTGNVGDITD